MDKKHKYLQLPRFQTHRYKTEAIAAVERHINENIADFTDGEEVIVEYLDAFGSQVYSNAVVCKKNDEPAKLFISIEENESLRLVSSDTEPEDKKVLWLTEDEQGDEYVKENYREEIDHLKETIRRLEEIINRHDYALSSTIAGGDIVTNSEKYNLENQATPERPEDAPEDTYAKTDFVVRSFDLFIGNSTLNVYNQIYKGQKYYLKLKMFNNAKEVVERTTETLTIECTPSERATVDDRDVLNPTSTGDIQIVATLFTKEGTRLRAIYNLNIEYNEEPDYATYSEPNVKHVILKTALNTTILKENANYLCINEPIWCISENALYVKAKTASGQIKLFKISGDGGSIDPDTGSTTGDTTAVTDETIFVVNDSGLTITSTDRSVYVDENGILNINVGRVDGDGILILNDTIITGSTTGDTEDTTTGIVDEDGELNIFGTASVDSNGVLILNGPHVNADGILEITS